MKNSEVLALEVDDVSSEVQFAVGMNLSTTTFVVKHKMLPTFIFYKIRGHGGSNSGFRVP